VHVNRVQFLAKVAILAACGFASACGAADRTDRSPDDEIDDRSRQDWVLSIAQTSPPIAVELILDDAVEPTARLNIPAGYIDPFIPGLFEDIEDGVYSARGVRLYFLKQDDQLRPWIDVVDQHVDRDVKFSFLAVPEDHLPTMLMSFDSDHNIDATFVRTGEFDYDLELAKYHGDDQRRYGVYLPDALSEQWFFIDCTAFNSFRAGPEEPNGFCSIFLFLTDRIITHGVIPYRDLENWRVYRDGYVRIFEDVIVGG
jgi:hypothetical protein